MKQTFVYILVLIIGFGLGYGIGHTPKDSAVPSMEHTMMSMSGDLVGKTGDDLDKAFLEGMIVHHEGAVEMAQILKVGTTRPELQKMADDIVMVQTGEIEMMKQWLTEWFGGEEHSTMSHE